MTQKLTIEQRAVYLASHRVRCPFCGSENIRSGPTDTGDHGITRNVSCEGCGEEWRDRYTLTGVYNADGTEVASDDPQSMDFGPPVRARICSDDRMVKVDFDASRWFVQASDAEIESLAAEDWGDGYTADAVGEFMSDYDENINKVFQYLELIKDAPTKKDCHGFEVTINEADAIAWLRAHNRPVPGDEEDEEEDDESE